jgi:hypothetical protein
MRRGTLNKAISVGSLFVKRAAKEDAASERKINDYEVAKGTIVASNPVEFGTTKKMHAGKKNNWSK